jgi:glycosyltransferase involved in cell wall biosynthesis
MLKRLAYYLVFLLGVLWWLLRNWRQYNVVVTSSPPITTELPGIVVSLFGKPWVADIRDLWIDAAVSLGHITEGSGIERLARRFQAYALQRADRITVTTEATVRSIDETYGPGLKGKSVLIPNGVDVDTFHPTDAAEFDHPVIVYTGNIGSAQDLESCVEAMALLEHDDAVLRLVGSGDMEPRLRELVEERSLSDRVEFTGLVPRDEVPGILNEASVGIAPLKDTDALNYAMPTKVYEYLACALPALVTGGDHVQAFIEESSGGVHVENDPARIATALDRLLADEAYRARLAEQGYEHVVERYTRNGIARRLNDELSEVIGQVDVPERERGAGAVLQDA